MYAIKYILIFLAFPTLAFGAFSYDVPYGSGDRSTDITITSSMTTSAGSIGNWINGNTADNNTYGPTISAYNEYVKFQFAEPIIIQAFKVYGTNYADMGIWQLQGSNDNSTWTNLGGTFTLSLTSGTYVEYTESSGNTTAYEFYKLNGESGTYSDGPYVHEYEFYWDYADIGGGEVATSTATSTASLGDIAFGQAIIITLMSFGLIGFTYNSISKKKSWKQ